MQTNSNDQRAHRNVDAAAEGAHDAVDWAANKANNAKESFNEASHEMKETQEKWLAVAREYVQQNPVASVGIALASGYLFGQIFRSR